MELPVVSALEFEQVKSSIKNFIKTKSDDFTDYDFEGSNMSMLVDILTYNTLYTSYNINMASNELNLDTAVLRDNVVALSKRLGYTPNSYTSAKAYVNLTLSNVNLKNFDEVQILQGSVLSASSDNKNYRFIIRDTLKARVKGRETITFSGVECIEGTEFAITYVVDESNEHQRFFIPNNFIDAETIRAFVITDPTTQREEEYTRKNTIVDVSGSDKVFFVEEIQDQKYEVVFGDDVIGRKLRDGEIVKLQYVISSGGAANNISNFNFIGKTKAITNTIETSLPSSYVNWELISDFSDGGSEFESIRSIKYRAPRYYASQGRAVTLSDYESIIQQIYSNAELVNVVGGETLNPPRYGKVFISIKPIIGETVSNIEKQRIIKELSNYKVGSVEVELLDPLEISIFAKPNVIYDKSKTKLRDFELNSLINDLVAKYTRSIEFNSFGGKYSDLEIRCDIKDLDSAIEYVTVPIYLSQYLKPVDRVETKYKLEYFTSLNNDGKSEYYLISEPFCVTNIRTPVFLGAKSNCEGNNAVSLYTVEEEYVGDVGTVNSQTGEVNIELNCCQTTPINIIVIPDVLEIDFGPNVVPNLVLNQSTSVDTIDNVGDRTDILNPDQEIIPIDDIINTPATGDQNVIIDPTLPLAVIDDPGGFIPVDTTTVDPGGDGPAGTGGPGPVDPVINDDNNIITIDDFTPETNPYSCS